LKQNFFRLRKNFTKNAYAVFAAQKYFFLGNAFLQKKRF
jgi:hypothetical protein